MRGTLLTVLCLIALSSAVVLAETEQYSMCSKDEKPDDEVAQENELGVCLRHDLDEYKARQDAEESQRIIKQKMDDLIEEIRMSSWERSIDEDIEPESTEFARYNLLKVAAELVIEQLTSDEVEEYPTSMSVAFVMSEIIGNKRMEVVF